MTSSLKMKELEIPIISFEDVTFSYNDASCNALEGVTIDINEGEFVCILGGNGSGKTTLAKTINALFVPKSGSVHICGLKTSDPGNVDSIRQYAGMVFQNPDDQMVGNFVEDDVAFGPENLCLPSHEIQERVNESLLQVGLQSFAKREIRSLSGGQKQRVAIAGALAMNPRILVLDEAGSMLDPRGRSGLLKACKKLNASGLTIVYVTHFLDEAAVADKVLVMDAGKVALFGKPNEILESREELHDLHLDTPFALKVCREIERHGVRFGSYISEREIVDRLFGMGFSSMEADASIEREEVLGPSDFEGLDFHKRQSSECDQALLRCEHVCYSYLDARSLKKALNDNKRSAREAFNLSCDEEGDTKTKWGADPTSIWAVEDVTLSVNAGDFLGIIGHTGSGKSTLARIIAGIIEPTTGYATFAGAGDASMKAVPSRVPAAIVMQYPEKQLFAQTVFEDCAFGPRNLGLPEDETRERVVSALRLVGLEGEGILEKSPFQLSGGQQRRVAIAGVLAMRPEILVLDEPTAGLDPLGCKSLLETIRKMHHEFNTTIVMVSHNMDIIAHLCNRVLVLNKGREFSYGTPFEVFSDGESLRKIGLALPATLKLASALSMKGFNNVPTIGQLVKGIVGGLPKSVVGGRIVGPPFLYPGETNE